MLILAALSMAVWVYLLAGRGRFWQAGPVLPPAPPGAPTPPVTIIVPARNEAEHILSSLRSLLAQDYAGPLRVILVDDLSTDGTGGIADAIRDDRLTVLRGAPHPPAWSGKLWALQQGVQEAGRAPLLLLTDADIEHAPGHLASLVAKLELDRLDMVSEMVALRTKNLAERALVPAFVFFFQLLYPFARVNDSGNPTAAAAGGTILIRREMLASVGGFSAMRGALIDDITLARRVKKRGRIWLGHSALAASIRPYETAGDVWRMVARCAYIQLGRSPWALVGTVGGMALVWLVPPLAALFGDGWARLAGLLAWAAMTLCYLPSLRRAGQTPIWAATLPFVATFYGAATLGSALDHYRGRGVVWKQRAYHGVNSASVLGDVESWSGKGRTQENFPVGSVLIRPELRRHVHAFYDFARNADDIADSPDLPAAEKIARLEVMQAVLTGARDHGAPSALALRNSLAETGMNPAHSLDLLHAFRQDAVKLRYASWEELLEYCRYSAMPVGRHVLALHGEPEDTVPPSDALCAVLQVLNHLQDMAKDLLVLDRCYLPADMLKQRGASLEDVKKPAETSGLRATKDALLDACDRLNAQAETLPRRVRDRRLRLETAVIAGLARRLARRLRHGDPLATRVKLRVPDVALSLASSVRFLP